MKTVKISPNLLICLVIAGLFFFYGLSFAQPLAFEMLTTENGLKIFYQQDPFIKFTTIVFHFTGGQALEKENQAGLAYLTTRLMAEVTDEYKLSDLTSDGVNLSAGSRPDFSFIRLDCNNQHLDRALAIIASDLKKPLFSTLRIGNLKQRLNLELNKESCRLVDSALICLRQQLFSASSYRFSIYGTEVSLKSLGKKEIKNFYEFILNTENLNLMVVSDLKAEEVIDLISKHFSWIKKPVNLPPKPVSKVVERKSNKNTAETEGCKYYQGPVGALVLLAYVLPGELSEIYPAAYLLEKIIGQGPGSIIWSLRQQEALAYNLNSRLEIFGSTGILVSYLETDSQNAKPALASLKETFISLGKKGLTEQEIEEAKLLARNSYLRESFSRDQRLAFLSLSFIGNQPLEFYNQFLDNLERLPADKINHLVQVTFKADQEHEVLIIRD
jgi:zinc protease